MGVNVERKVAVVGADGRFIRLEELAEDQAPGADHVVLSIDGAGLVRAALVDANALLVRVDAVAPDGLTNRHLPMFAELDLDPVRGYKWTPTPGDARNALRGRWDPLPRKTPERKFDDAEPLPALAAFWIMLFLKDGELALPARTLAWLDQYVRSVDFRGTLESSPEAQEYWRRRGLKN
jgi:hypothetical protein